LQPVIDVPLERWKTDDGKEALNNHGLASKPWHVPKNAKHGDPPRGHGGGTLIFLRTSRRLIRILLCDGPKGAWQWGDKS